MSRRRKPVSPAATRKAANPDIIQDACPAGVGADQTQEDPQRGGLARTVRSKETVHLAGLNRKLQPVKGPGVAEGFRKARDVDDCAHGAKLQLSREIRNACTRLPGHRRRNVAAVIRATKQEAMTAGPSDPLEVLLTRTRGSPPVGALYRNNEAPPRTGEGIWKFLHARAVLGGASLGSVKNSLPEGDGKH